MQVLWSRAAQTNSCRCRSCLNAATTLARRTTTAASRRRLELSDLFTACYSTILGTAVFADARVKENRRKEWDRLIAEARADLSVGLEDGDRSRAHKGVEEEHTASAQGALPLKELISPAWNQTTWTAPQRNLASLEKQLKVLDSHIKQSLTPQALEEVSLRRDEAINVDEWDDIDEGHDSLQAREPLTRVHVRMMQEMIAKLVARLLLSTKPFSAKHGESHISAMVGQIEALQSGHTRLPSYTARDWESFNEERRDLNRSILEIFQKATTKAPNIDLMLAKICYNLLVSTAPPCIKTYNILIHQLTNLGRPEIAEVVVDSFLYDSRYRPDQKTIRYILDVYIAKKDKQGFRAIVNRMRGVDQDMRVRRRGLHFLQSPTEQAWALSNKVIHRNGHVLQKVQRNTSIFDALIRGSVELVGVRSAIQYIRAALREGFRINQDTLSRVIGACIARLDVEAARSLLRALLSRWCASLVASPTIEYDAKTRHHIYQLVSLCGIQLPLQREKSLPSGIPQKPLKRLLNHLCMDSINATIDRIATTISGLNHVLGVAPLSSTSDLERTAEIGSLRSDNTLNWSTQAIDRALTILDEASATEARKKASGSRDSARNRDIPLRVIEAKLRSAAKEINIMNKFLLDNAYNELPTHRKKQYVNEIQRVEGRSIFDMLDIALSLKKREQTAMAHKVVGSRLGHCVKQIQSIEKEIMDAVDALQHASNTSTTTRKAPLRTGTAKVHIDERAAQAKGVHASSPKWGPGKQDGERQIRQLVVRRVESEVPTENGGPAAACEVSCEQISHSGEQKPNGQLEVGEDAPIAAARVSKAPPTAKKAQGKQVSPHPQPAHKTIWLPPPTTQTEAELNAAAG